MADEAATSLAAVSLSCTAPAEVAEQRFCVTTAINYANGLPHMGHAYEAVSADVLARYHRAFGRQVLFMTGADEHGQKIADAAAQRGVTPIELCDQYVAKFQVCQLLPSCLDCTSRLRSLGANLHAARATGTQRAPEYKL